MGSRIPALRLSPTLPPIVSRVAAWVRPAGDDRELPLVYRLAIIYLMLPVVIWLVGWFEWWLGIPAALLLVAAFWQAVCGSWRPSLRVTTIAILPVAACWVMLTQAGGVFDFGLIDWYEFKSTFLDLGRYPWPTFLQDPLRVYVPEEEAYSFPLLRYYLGYFMTPGLVGRWLGPAALNWAVPLWTCLGVALVLLMFVRERRGWSIALAVAVIIFFSGMDVLRLILTEGWSWIRIEWDGLPGIDITYGHIERVGLIEVGAQYSSNMTALMWVPQHFIPAGLYTFLMLHLRGHRRFLAVSGVLLAAAPLWSGFVAIGLLPLIAILLWENGIRPFLRWPNLLLAAPLAGLIALYLTSGALDFLPFWIWERDEWSLIVRWVPLFYLSDFLLLVVLLWVLRPDLRREPFFIACTASLLLLPLYHYGPSNDLLLRASMPHLLLLCWYCTEAILGHGRARTCAPRGRKYSLGIVCVVAILAIGSVTALVELSRAINNVGSFRYENSRYTTFLLPSGWQKQNTAHDIPNMLRLLLDEDDIRPIYNERGELIARSKFDVYLEEDRMILVNDRCIGREIEDFFLYAIPAHQDVLPAEKRALGLDYYEFSSIPSLEGFPVWHKMRTSGGTCVVMLPMPQYPVDGFRVGQWAQDSGADWQASYDFDAHIDLLYRSLTSGELVIRAQFDVYLDENRLTYVKEPCDQADTEHGFFLHITPVDEADLPKDRREYRFDNRDFGFGTYGFLVDGRCLAVRFLPDYDILKISTGQFTDEGKVWSEVYSYLSNSEIYHSLTSGDPIIRAQFDVYLDENRLTYVKEPCDQADTEHRFFLHVTPVDEADLPEDRREYGFDNRDFVFGDYGILVDDRCVALRSLPDYDIAEISTGQFTDEGQVWSEVYSHTP